METLLREMSVGHGCGVFLLFLVLFLMSQGCELVEKLLICVCSQHTFLLKMVQKHHWWWHSEDFSGVGFVWVNIQDLSMFCRNTVQKKV